MAMQRSRSRYPISRPLIKGGTLSQEVIKALAPLAIEHHGHGYKLAGMGSHSMNSLVHHIRKHRKSPMRGGRQKRRSRSRSRHRSTSSRRYHSRSISGRGRHHSRSRSRHRSLSGGRRHSRSSSRSHSRHRRSSSKKRYH